MLLSVRPIMQVDHWDWVVLSNFFPFARSSLSTRYCVNQRCSSVHFELQTSFLPYGTIDSSYIPSRAHVFLYNSQMRIRNLNVFYLHASRFCEA